MIFLGHPEATAETDDGKLRDAAIANRHGGPAPRLDASLTDPRSVGLSSRRMPASRLAARTAGALMGSGRDEEQTHAQSQVAGHSSTSYVLDARERAEEALRASDERFRAIFNQAAVGIALAGLDGRILQANQRMSEILGYPHEELSAHTFTDLTHPDDRAATQDRARQLMAGNIEEYVLEKRYLHKSGGSVWCLTSVTLLRDTEGRPVYFIGIVEDMSERKKTELALRQTAQRLQLALAAGQLGDWSWDAATDEVIFGTRAAEIFGLRASEPLTWTGLRSLLVDEDAERARLAVEHALETHTVYDIEYRVDRPDGGGRRWIAARGTGFYDTGGTVLGMIGVVQDITERKETDAARMRLAAVVESSGDAIISKTLEGIITSWNLGAERMFGYNAGEVVGKPITLLIPPERLDEEPTILRRIAAGERIQQYESVRVHKDGRRLDVSLSVSPVKDHNGRIIGASKIARDIGLQKLTEAAAQREIARREQAEQALRETDRRKDEFLATLAHELRNPLAPIRQAALISQAPGATEAQKRWGHEVITRQVQHMSLLLDDLLDVSRITRGTLELRKKRTELASIIDAAVETARPVIDSKRHHLQIAVPPERIHFEADPLRIAQVLSNLLTNAAKYTDPEGTIRLSAKLDQDTIEVAVSDTGIGISAESLPDIFRMFSQVKSHHDRSDGGLGIGLALAKGLVSLHGGTIEARSQGPGHGSEFAVRLPMGATTEPSQEAPPGDGATTCAAGRRVLIADDNRDAAESLAMLLRMDGHDVSVATDGTDAVQMFAKLQPQFAILDIGMPGLNGYEVARRMRKESKGRPLRLIAVTGWGAQADKALAFAAGFDNHFTKPLEPEKLLELLRT
jgi:PAS domain S-box-containing protein